jgi:hypothetical protein
LKYLCSDYNYTSRQTDEGVASLADTLQDFGLTKGEVLQIVNLAPTEQVELYCVSLPYLFFYHTDKQIIEQPDDRFHPETPQRLDEISQQVRSTLLDYPPEHLYPFLPIQEAVEGEAEGGEEYDAAGAEYEAAMMEQEFVHEEEWGAGHEDGVGEEKEDPVE